MGISTLPGKTILIPVVLPTMVRSSLHVECKITQEYLPGFECLTVDESTNTLWAMLQSATIQDGGNKKSNSRYTRLLAYDISSPLTVRPNLTAEYMVPLPLDDDGKTLGASEIHFISENLFLVLARDGNGHGGDDTDSLYKWVFLRLSR